LPGVPITSAAFQSSNSASTNIADTFPKARARIAAEQATRPASHGPTAGMAALMTINRARRHRQPTEPAAFRGAVAMRIFVRCGCIHQHIARSAESRLTMALPSWATWVWGSPADASDRHRAARAAAPRPPAQPSTKCY
jgi:hypothetical protein